MSADLDLSPPEVPEPTFLESVLRYGLFLGAIFQLICILAIIFPNSKGHEHVCVQSWSPLNVECMFKTKQKQTNKKKTQQIIEDEKKHSVCSEIHDGSVTWVTQ